MRSADFFDAAKWPNATFKSTKVEKGDGNEAQGHRRPDDPRRHQARRARRDAQQGRRGPQRRAEDRLRRDDHDQAQRIRRGEVHPERQRRRRHPHHDRSAVPQAEDAKRMIVERPAAARGEVSAGWLHSRHTFSFGHYHDPQWMGFGPLRVINEDIVAPRRRLPAAPAREHGNPQRRVVRRARAPRQHRRRGRAAPGRSPMDERRPRHRAQRIQRVAKSPVHFLQIWIQPDRLNAQPAYEQRAFDPAARGAAGTSRLARWRGGGACRCASRPGCARCAWRRRSGRRRAGSRASYWLHVATGDVASTAARCRRAMRWASSTKPATPAGRSRRRHRRRAAVRPAGLTTATRAAAKLAARAPA